MSTEINTSWSYISNWMNANAASEYIAECIAKGIYQKGQIKKSSPRFANKKDKTAGYECRIIAISGIHTDMEISVVGYRKTRVTKVKIDTSKLHAIKQLLKIENVATDDNGQLKVTDKCVHLKDGSRIQLFTSKK